MFYKQNWKPRGRGPRRVGEAIWPGDGDRVGEEKICRGEEFGAGAPSPPNPTPNVVKMRKYIGPFLQKISQLL